MPHRVKPALHVKPHWPPTHAAVALATVVVHTLPQVPQLFTSVSTLVHTPPHLSSPALGHPADAQAWVTGTHVPEVGLPPREVAVGQQY